MRSVDELPGGLTNANYRVETESAVAEFDGPDVDRLLDEVRRPD